MIILGIETSCDETSAALVRDGRELISEVTATQMQIHAAFGGVVPEVASRHHVEDITRVVDETFREAGSTWQDVDAIAVTCGPGLLGSLLVGVSAAKGYALATGKPLIGVHHIAGHVAAATLNSQIRPPFLCLVVSGGHTELLTVDEQFCFTKLGGTRDDAAGEAYDKVARLIGLAYPGGPKVDELAHDGNQEAYAFPRGLLDEEGYDFSFSGLKSAVNNALTKQRNRREEIDAKDVCASFQAAVIDVLEEKTRRALAHTGYQRLVVAGGVAANRGLRSRFTALASATGVEVVFPPLRWCTDNAAMIASAGYYRFQQGKENDLSLNAYAQLSLDTWQSWA
ncbi:tRNA (adenosine(37)-N6)-threonylcarbamoyltransferase complex transferase subunit TsaD [Alicyclobacillus suci]|uniref:tRNA (adenosine(37)-N6)-threonylcarbamoyltransferase complex transferase subunit TsaD n=1 Tax=Alicyclobacillus suci TaxID=2816080 RepID=UPI001A8D7788|nr:tRNA (adenosine(37)-N6)-threonylcarbamoyltransferase complex transferase subunit TsaD [Alicyclobacillus suci]